MREFAAGTAALIAAAFGSGKAAEPPMNAPSAQSSSA